MNNGTPYTNEQWGKWANYKSNKDMAIEQEERENDELYQWLVNYYLGK
jgi:hypothetical protein